MHRKLSDRLHLCQFAKVFADHQRKSGMNCEAMEKLHLDRRLINRRGWISKAELEKALEALPDVSDKIAPLEEEEPVKDEAAEETAPGTAVEPEVVPPRVE